jgi:hypothetical protein
VKIAAALSLIGFFYCVVDAASHDLADLILDYVIWAVWVVLTLRAWEGERGRTHDRKW